MMHFTCDSYILTMQMIIADIPKLARISYEESFGCLAVIADDAAGTGTRVEATMQRPIVQGEVMSLQRSAQQEERPAGRCSLDNLRYGVANAAVHFEMKLAC